MSTRSKTTPSRAFFRFFFFNDTATTEIYTLSLHDALPISLRQEFDLYANVRPVKSIVPEGRYPSVDLVVIRENTEGRSEEHTSELQSPCNLVCRLLLEKKKNQRSWSLRVRRHSYVDNQSVT